MIKKPTVTLAMSGAPIQDGSSVVRISPDWPEDKVLNREAESFLQRLPEEVRPLQLSKKFPRICNRIAELWTDPEVAIHFFDDLLIDHRGGRDGFPLMIIMEISSLKEHLLASCAAVKLDVWKTNRNLL